MFCVGKAGWWNLVNIVMVLCYVVLGDCFRVCYEQSDGNDVLVLLALED